MFFWNVGYNIIQCLVFVTSKGIRLFQINNCSNRISNLIESVLSCFHNSHAPFNVLVFSLRFNLHSYRCFRIHCHLSETILWHSF